MLIGIFVLQVLIYDRFGQDIISPLLSVKELRDMGITLHLYVSICIRFAVVLLYTLFEKTCGFLW